MAKKLSNATRSKMSNAVHKRLLDKNIIKFNNAKTQSAKSKARVNMNYHQQVIVFQTNEGRVLDKRERQGVWSFLDEMETGLYRDKKNK